MQRYITIRFLQSLLALFVMSIIVFSMARMTGDPLDVLLPIVHEVQQAARPATREARG